MEMAKEKPYSSFEGSPISRRISIPLGIEDENYQVVGTGLH
jgi:hypothetical protein